MICHQGLHYLHWAQVSLSIVVKRLFCFDIRLSLSSNFDIRLSLSSKPEMVAQMSAKCFASAKTALKGSHREHNIWI